MTLLVLGVLPAALLAMGVPTEIAQATVRFSMGKETNAGQILEVAGKLKTIADRLR